jgi:serine protease inhibitor
MVQALVLGSGLIAAGLVVLAGGAAVASPPAKPDAAPVDAAACAPAVGASNAFGLDLYRRLAAEERGGNLFLSPYSVATAMTIVAEGAHGATRDEMAGVLHFPAGPDAGATLAAQHEAHAAVARRLTEAAGSTDPEAPRRLAAMRAELDKLNAEAERLARPRAGEKWWEAASKAQAAARAKADEINRLEASVGRFDLRVANALWIDRAFPIAPAYVRTIDARYAARLSALDIRGDAEGSRRRINAWVEERTAGRIKDLIPAKALPPTTPMVVTNAVYFKGQWDEPFAAAQTRAEPFTLADGTKTDCRLMLDHHRGGVPYAAFNPDGTPFATPQRVAKDEAARGPTYPGEGGFTMIELPYKGRELAMLVIAPRSPAGLPALEARLTADNLATWTKALAARTVDTGLPRFRMESEFGLGETLKAMGMRRAFSADDADFSGLTDSADPAHRLCIGAVRHKSWVEVTEKGTEAAAATAVMMAPTSAMRREEETVPFIPVFRADRPFVFVIRDTRTGLVLFVGRCTRPESPG